MQILIDESGSPRLVAPEVFNEFAVHLHRRPTIWPMELVPEGDQHVWVDEAWLRKELAGAKPVPDWEEKLNGMLTYARHKGWTRENPPSVRAHIASR